MFSRASGDPKVFHTEPTKLVEGNLTLKKSALAVPISDVDVLVIKAFLKDVDFAEIIVKSTPRYCAEHESDSNEWLMEGKIDVSILKLVILTFRVYGDGDCYI
ncbi:hypothetical protein Tco_0914739 [Tanacetum coccineum]